MKYWAYKSKYTKLRFGLKSWLVELSIGEENNKNGHRQNYRTTIKMFVCLSLMCVFNMRKYVIILI